MNRQGPFNKELYRRRNLIERLIGRFKQYRRIATRYEKRGENYRGDVGNCLYSHVVMSLQTRPSQASLALQPLNVVSDTPSTTTDQSMLITVTIIDVFAVWTGTGKALSVDSFLGATGLFSF